MAAVLCLVDRRSNRLASRLRAAGHKAFESLTPDHAVSECVNHDIDLAVLDQAIFVETDCWSVARSLKSVRREVLVVLMTRGVMIGDHKPLGVDAVLGHGAIAELLQFLEELDAESRADREDDFQQPITDTIQ